MNMKNFIRGELLFDEWKKLYWISIQYNEGDYFRNHKSVFIIGHSIPKSWIVFLNKYIILEQDNNESIGIKLVEL